jgi:hypothetical protein
MSWPAAVYAHKLCMLQAVVVALQLKLTLDVRMAHVHLFHLFCAWSCQGAVGPQCAAAHVLVAAELPLCAGMQGCPVCCCRDVQLQVRRSLVYESAQCNQSSVCSCLLSHHTLASCCWYAYAVTCACVFLLCCCVYSPRCPCPPPCSIIAEAIHKDGRLFSPDWLPRRLQQAMSQYK